MMRKATEEEFDMTKRYVIGHEEELKRKYGNNYVALIDNNVVDHDPNALRLFNRVQQRKDIDRLPIIAMIDGLIEGDN